MGWNNLTNLPLFIRWNGQENMILEMTGRRWWFALKKSNKDWVYKFYIFDSILDWKYNRIIHTSHTNTSIIINDKIGFTNFIFDSILDWKSIKIYIYIIQISHTNTTQHVSKSIILFFLGGVIEEASFGHQTNRLTCGITFLAASVYINNIKRCKKDSEYAEYTACWLEKKNL